MAVKRVYRADQAEAVEKLDPWTVQERAQKFRLRIEGLTQLEPGLFELDADLIPREIDWPMVALGLGFKGAPFPDTLADAISAEVFREDMITALRERIKL